jgi:hypothetical protein
VLRRPGGPRDAHGSDPDPHRRRERGGRRGARAADRRIQAGEAQGLLGAGTPAPDARVLFFGLGRLEVALPASFPAGAAEAQLFVIDEGETILSDPLPVLLEASP